MHHRPCALRQAARPIAASNGVAKTRAPATVVQRPTCLPALARGLTTNLPSNSPAASKWLIRLAERVGGGVGVMVPVQSCSLLCSHPSKPSLAEGHVQPPGQHWFPAQAALVPGHHTTCPTRQRSIGGKSWGTLAHSRGAGGGSHGPGGSSGSKGGRVAIQCRELVSEFPHEAKLSGLKANWGSDLTHSNAFLRESTASSRQTVQDQPSSHVGSSSHSALKDQK
mmetsp:Transcript_117901/g.380522  ORF Transcript_117901/g.380522 Transcript_117901/m.380522 type:complete len:224 (+) Transcript_117901:309-980(+)